MERDLGDKWALPKQYRDFVTRSVAQIKHGDAEIGQKGVCDLIGKTMWAKNILVQAGLALANDPKCAVVIRFWELATTLDPLDQELMRMLKVRYRRTGQRAKVKECSEKLREIKRIQNLCETADQAFRSGRYEEASVILRQIIEARPGVIQHYGDLGTCLLEIGAFAEAKDFFEQLVNSCSNPRVRDEFERQLAKALFGLGQVDRAIAILQKNNALTRDAKANNQPLPSGYDVSRLSEVEIQSLKGHEQVTFHEIEANSRVTQHRANTIPPMLEVPETYEIERHGLYVAEVKNVEVVTDDGLIIDGDKLLCPNPGLTAKSKQDNIRFFTQCYNQARETLVVTPQTQTLSLKKAALLTSRVSNNYFHWLLEQLPRVLLLEELSEHPHAPLLIRRDMPPQHFQALKMLVGDQRELIMLNARSRVHVEQLIVPSMPGYHPPEYYYYVRDGRRAPYAIEVHPWAVQRMRQKILNRVSPPPEGQRLRLFLIRPETGNRGCCNETELYPLLEQLGFTMVNTAQHSFEEQVRFTSCAEIMMGNVGAAFANMIFAPEGCHVIGLQNETADPTLCDQIGRLLGQRFVVIRGRSIPNTGNLIHSHFHINPEYLVKNLTELLAQREPVQTNRLSP